MERVRPHTNLLAFQFINVKGGESPYMIFDGGDIPFSVSVLNDIGKAIAAVLLKPSHFRNRFIHMQSAAITQNQMLNYARELQPDRVIKPSHWTRLSLRSKPRSVIVRATRDEKL